MEWGGGAEKAQEWKGEGMPKYPNGTNLVPCRRAPESDLPAKAKRSRLASAGALSRASQLNRYSHYYPSLPGVASHTSCQSYQPV